jgi:protein-S-isoprenylcysteine O-methyltransferase Ste14
MPIAIIAALLILCLQNSISVAALPTRDRSFSLIPKAKRLVTKGPYSSVRYPNDLGEVLAYAGRLLQPLFLFPWLVLAVFTWVQIQHINDEEAILEECLSNTRSINRGSLDSTRTSTEARRPQFVRVPKKRRSQWYRVENYN